MKRLILATAALGLLGSSCYVHHHRHPHHRPPPPPPPREHRSAPPAPEQPVPAPTPPPAPAYGCQLTTGNARAGDEVTLRCSAPGRVEVYYNGRILPKVVKDSGQTIVLTVPGDATSGYFEVEWNGRRYRVNPMLNIVPH